MPVYYLDSRALAKRYFRELGSEWVDDLLAREPVGISALSKVELASALARRVREGMLGSAQRDAIYRRFLVEARTFAVTTLSASIVRQAAVMLHATPSTVAMRSLDALHLATARAVFARARRHAVVDGRFVASDRALIVAARWAGLTVVNPEDYP